MYIILAIVALSFMAIAHEYGHFLAAKRSGIAVEEFSLGFGPKVISYKKDETQYSIRLIPFLAYVKIKGEEGESEDPDSFYAKPVSKRLLTILAGPVMNIIIAVLIFFLTYSVYGDISHLSTKLEDVTKDLPAYEAGIRAGDKIVEINGVEIKSWEDVINEISGSNGEEIVIKVEREGKILSFNIKPVKSEDGRWIIGIVSDFEKVNIFEAFWLALKEIWRILTLVALSLRMIVRGNVSGIAGPVGIVKFTADVGKQAGGIAFIWFTGVISLALGVTNLLPIPALDGGRLMFILYEAITKRRVPPEKENVVHFIGYIILIGLLFVITFFDILRFFK